MKEIGQNCIQTDFVLDDFDKDRSNVPQLDQQDVYLFIESFLNNMNSILDEPGLGMMHGRQPMPVLSPAQIKKKEAQVSDEKPAQR